MIFAHVFSRDLLFEVSSYCIFFNPVFLITIAILKIYFGRKVNNRLTSFLTINPFIIVVKLKLFCMIICFHFQIQSLWELVNQRWSF